MLNGVRGPMLEILLAAPATLGRLIRGLPGPGPAPHTMVGRPARSRCVPGGTFSVKDQA